LFIGNADAADKVRFGVSNYNISNLTVGVAQTRGFFKQEGIDAEVIRMNPNVATTALVNWAKFKPEFAEAGYDSVVGAFSADGSIPEDGMRVVLDGLRKSMNIARYIPLSEVADPAPLLEVQRELGLRK